MEDITLSKLQNFFIADARIKRKMYSNAPPPVNVLLKTDHYYDYVDSLNDNLPDIISDLKQITVNFFGDQSELYRHIEELEARLSKELDELDSPTYIDTQKLQRFYEKYVTKMEPDFENVVQSTCVGYTLFRDLPVDRANSINEILHLIHAFIMNNEDILQSVGVLQEKTNQKDYPITLRGVPSERFAEIYMMFPDDLDVGYTDMICLSNRRMLMMVRDRGHALTMETSVDDGVARIEYFIPKICNAEMVNSLPGLLNKVNERSTGAIGAICIPEEELSTTLIDFISRVPMDKDIPKKEVPAFIK